MRRQITIALVLGVLLLSTVFVLGQGGTSSPTAQKTVLLISVFHQTCSLVEADASAATPEATTAATAAATAEASATQEESINYPILTLGDDCVTLAPQLEVHSNDTLWFEVRMPREVVWQQFETVEGDPFPPALDKRGRYIGCKNTQAGQEVYCQALWQSDVTYLIRIPIRILGEYIAPTTPAPTATAALISTPSPLATSLNATDTGWGSCGSCSTCGGPVEQCVTAPGGVCAWDAATCEHPKHQ